MVKVVEPLPGFTFGCDPELFVTNSDGVFVSAEGLIPGTKEEPYPVECGAVQVDGMAAEFNINPASSFDEFNTNISTVMKQLKKMLPKGYDLQPVSSITFTEEMWNEAPDKAKILGCSPDFNAWTGDVNPPPNDPDNPRLRTAAGHLHIGWQQDGDTSDVEHINNCFDLVKQMDWYLGAWSINKDPDGKLRRALYGRAGACRIKPYGVEYRVLSNFWLKDATSRMQVWNRMNSAIRDMSRNFIPGSPIAVHHKYRFNEVLIESINSSKLATALADSFTHPIKVCTNM